MSTTPPFEPKVGIGTFVNIASRTWPGINSPGGVGRITQINHQNGTCDVDYVMGGKEKTIALEFMTEYKFNEENNRKSSRRGASGRYDSAETADTRIVNRKDQSVQVQVKKPSKKSAKKVASKKRKNASTSNPEKASDPREKKQKDTPLACECPLAQKDHFNDSCAKESAIELRSTNTTPTSTAIDTLSPQAPRQYAYVDDTTSSSITIFHVINANTTHEELGKIYNEQKRRFITKTPLAVYEVDRENDGRIRLIRKIDGGEQIHLNFGRKRKSRTTSEVNATARKLLQLEIEKAGLPSTYDNAKLKTNELVLPMYFEPSFDKLRAAHDVLKKFLPSGDCEPFHSVEVAYQYYEYFRPEKVKVILLAESHVYTDEDVSKHGPIIGTDELSNDEYDGPRPFVALVYCL